MLSVSVVRIEWSYNCEFFFHHIVKERREQRSRILRQFNCRDLFVHQGCVLVRWDWRRRKDVSLYRLLALLTLCISSDERSLVAHVNNWLILLCILRCPSDTFSVISIVLPVLLAQSFQINSPESFVLLLNKASVLDRDPERRSWSSERSDLL